MEFERIIVVKRASIQKINFGKRASTRQSLDMSNNEKKALHVIKLLVETWLYGNFPRMEISCPIIV